MLWFEPLTAAIHPKSVVLPPLYPENCNATLWCYYQKTKTVTNEKTWIHTGESIKNSRDYKKWYRGILQQLVGLSFLKMVLFEK